MQSYLHETAHSSSKSVSTANSLLALLMKQSLQATKDGQTMKKIRRKIRKRTRQMFTISISKQRSPSPGPDHDQSGGGAGSGLKKLWYDDFDIFWFRWTCAPLPKRRTQHQFLGTSCIGHCSSSIPHLHLHPHPVPFANSNLHSRDPPPKQHATIVGESFESIYDLFSSSPFTSALPPSLSLLFSRYH